MPACTLQLHTDGTWVDAGRLEIFDVERGYEGRSQFDYDIDYATARPDARDERAASCNYPINFDVYTSKTWPAFVFDILPSGAGRRALLESLGLDDSRRVDWELLLKGAGHPPGNLRVAEAAQRRIDRGRGFSVDEITTRSETFVAAMAEVGSIVAGASVGGEAPKFLLTEDERGAYHPDGSLDDADARAHWLVKYPRNDRDSDRTILRNECAYHRVAKAVGLSSHGTPRFDRNTLFVPRFDRLVGPRGVERYGLESLASLCSVSMFGRTLSHQAQCAALVACVDEPARALIEYVKRDIMNLALGNTDNHGRNTSILKANGAIGLAPIYDFAPMFLDEEIIPRSSKWEQLEKLNVPDWPKVMEALPVRDGDAEKVRRAVVDFVPVVRRLPDVMRTCGVDDEVIERRVPFIDEQARALDALVATRSKVEG